MKNSTDQYLNHLKYSPSLLGYLNLLIKQQRQMTTIRLLTVLLVLLSCLITMHTISYHTTGSLAASSNDIVYGGLGSKEGTIKQTMLQVLDGGQNPGGYRERDIVSIMSHFGINERSIRDSQLVDICTDCYESSDLMIIGRSPSSAVGSRYSSAIEIDGSSYYVQKLSGLYDNYKLDLKALKVDPDTFILADSGNVVYKPKTSLVAYSQYMDRSDQVIVNQSIPYEVGEYLRQKIEIVKQGDSPLKNLRLQHNLPANVSVNNILSSTSFDQSELSDTTNSSESLELVWNKLNKSELSVTLTYSLPNPDTEVIGELCPITTVTSLETSAVEVQNCIEFGEKLEPGASSTKLEVNEFSPLVNVQSTVENLTTPIDSLSAQASDELRYTVAFENLTHHSVVYNSPDFDVTDIREYAGVVDLGDATLNNNHIKWPVFTLAPGQTITKSFTVKIFDKLPNTNQSLSNPKSYDCKLSSNYSNYLEIDLPCSPIKAVEQASTTLPTINNNLIVAGLITVLAIAGISYVYGANQVHALEKAKSEYA